MNRPTIHFTIRSTALGALLVAGTARGVCFVRFAAPGAGRALEEALLREFPCAEIETADEAPGARRLRGWADSLAARVAGHDDGEALPLDVSGSRFERRVWAALSKIPRGQTRHYGEIARALGMPKGARAVARACAANPVPVALPCHRVVPLAAAVPGTRRVEPGAVGGYSGGVPRKRALLRAEGALVSSGSDIATRRAGSRPRAASSARISARPGVSASGESARNPMLS